ncbi:MAG: low molecular weight protein-tyrosine-phosphatase [Bacteroidota bacterium]
MSTITIKPLVPVEDALRGDRPIRVLFVCLGNICRSPLAEGVFRHHVDRAGLTDRFEIDSAGTGRWHVGEPPDPRMRGTARDRGLSIDDQRARQAQGTDLRYYDHIFTMDRSNLHDVLFLDPQGANSYRVRLFREFDPDPEDYQVPDPYSGQQEGFDLVFNIVDRTSAVILSKLTDAYQLRA